MTISLKRLASLAAIACAVVLALAPPAIAQQPQAAAGKPGYADPDGVPPRPPAVDIEPGLSQARHRHPRDHPEAGRPARRRGACRRRS